eukprot:2110020-Pleurochrysis_carterae.AAC.1
MRIEMRSTRLVVHGSARGRSAGGDKQQPGLLDAGLSRAQPEQSSAVGAYEPGKTDAGSAFPPQRLRRADVGADGETHRVEQQIMHAHLAADSEIRAEVPALVLSQVEQDVSGIHWTVEFFTQVKAANYHSRATVSSRPPHPVKLKLHSPFGEKGIVGLKRLQVFERSR